MADVDDAKKRVMGLIDEVRDRAHRHMYERAIPMAQRMAPDVVLPPWDELTEAQKEKIRQANREHLQYMNALGDNISNGDA